jgi:hypothetical protein
MVTTASLVKHLLCSVWYSWHTNTVTTLIAGAVVQLHSLAPHSGADCQYHAVIATYMLYSSVSPSAHVLRTISH